MPIVRGCDIAVVAIQIVSRVIRIFFITCDILPYGPAYEVCKYNENLIYLWHELCERVVTVSLVVNNRVMVPGDCQGGNLPVFDIVPEMCYIRILIVLI